MSNYRKIMLCAVVLAVAVSGCAIQPVHEPGKEYIAANQQKWLAKAYRQDRDGWIFLHIEGGPFERGFQRGYLTANEIDRLYKTMAYVQEFETGRDIDFFVNASAKLFRGKVSKEYVDEMAGMAAGATAAGKDISYEQMLFLNGFIDVCWYWWPQEQKRLRDDGPGCSAFVATGDATADGRIVMGHNTWSPYATLQYCNQIVDILPDKGHRILMQSWGPCIYSGTDFFITSAGLVGTETTIGGFSGFNSKGTPVFERARRAMQYAGNIDEWAQIMIKNNNGAYANSWLLGDVNTGEIAQLELGLKNHSLLKKKNGYFTGSNVADNIKILRQETDSPYDDIRNGWVARRVRWRQLMKKYYGKIDVDIAKKMLADHYDVYLKKQNPCSRTICGHFELDDGRYPGSPTPYKPSGTIDGKVVDSTLAKSWQIWAKWGKSCNTGFDAKQFLKEHSQYDWLAGYLPDLPVQSWTIFPSEK